MAMSEVTKAPFLIVLKVLRVPLVLAAPRVMSLLLLEAFKFRERLTVMLIAGEKVTLFNVVRGMLEVILCFLSLTGW